MCERNGHDQQQGRGYPTDRRLGAAGGQGTRVLHPKHLPSGVRPSSGNKRRVVKLFEFRFYLFIEVIEIERHRGALQLHCGNDPSLCEPYSGLNSVFFLGRRG